MCRSVSTMVMVLLWPCMVFAAHPLITDDAGTQGKGKFQLEVNGQYDSDTETVNSVSVKTTGGQATMALTYGIIDSIDLAVGIPYQWIEEKDDGVLVSNEHGISDATLDIKWRFFEKDGLSFAVKPGASFPTGDEDKGLGTGKTGYHVFLIGTKEAAPWAFHANLDYIRNESKFDENKNLWHASLATTCEIVKNLKLVGNVGIERNPDKAADRDPAFLIAGIIYSFSENLDVDFGVKAGITRAETDYSILAGLTYRL
ncbi:MAG: transporter [Deltaproteobacteria bacterium]|nr:transporter [Deltaproteobacteria bacterium]